MLSPLWDFSIKVSNIGENAKQKSFSSHIFHLIRHLLFSHTVGGISINHVIGFFFQFPALCGFLCQRHVGLSIAIFLIIFLSFLLMLSVQKWSGRKLAKIRFSFSDGFSSKNEIGGKKNSWGRRGLVWWRNKSLKIVFDLRRINLWSTEILNFQPSTSLSRVGSAKWL